MGESPISDGRNPRAQVGEAPSEPGSSVGLRSYVIPQPQPI